MTTLVVTNDFPPRVGGIENFVAAACRLLDGDVVVLTRTERNSAATRDFDQSVGYPVVRIPGPLLPIPSVERLAAALLRETRADRVLYGAAAPLGLLAPRLRRAGAHTQVALSHGHEVWWARVPGAREALRSIVAGVDAVGVISRFTRDSIAAILPPFDRRKLIGLPPPVDLDVFSPSAVPAPPVVLASGRLVRQKGFETLLDAWPLVVRDHPEAHLRIAGDGPLRDVLARRAALLPSVTLTGALAYADMPEAYRAAAVFALPVRTRFAGLNPEGLGSVFCEAAASGLALVVGRSGGAPETVVEGVSGHVVPPDDAAATARAISSLLADPARARAMGRAGRAHIAGLASSEVVGAALRRALRLPRDAGDR